MYEICTNIYPFHSPKSRKLYTIHGALIQVMDFSAKFEDFSPTTQCRYLQDSMIEPLKIWFFSPLNFWILKKQPRYKNLVGSRKTSRMSQPQNVRMLQYICGQQLATVCFVAIHIVDHSIMTCSISVGDFFSRNPERWESQHSP